MFIVAKIKKLSQTTAFHIIYFYICLFFIYLYAIFQFQQLHSSYNIPAFLMSSQPHKFGFHTRV